MDLRSATVRLASSDRRRQLRPAVAVATSLLVMLALARFGPSVRAFGAAFLLCVVAALAVVDLEQRRIPNCRRPSPSSPHRSSSIPAVRRC